ncbi:DUF6868 family protein [Roseovarius sp. 2305UL8-3]|uniref:DUF6868 family protein n=1 Tax=Roseovarius conchicola TaxID=3121636 RepID=UPI0035290525
MTQDMLTNVFGWMVVLNFGILLISTFLILVLRDWVSELHSRLFGLDAAVVRQTMYVWLGGYKLALIVLTLVPYLALRLM